MIALVLLAVTAQDRLPQGPVEFTARTMRMEPRDHRAVLDGSVRLTRGDLGVTGDHAVLEFAPEEKPARAGRKPDAASPGFLGQSVQRFLIDGSVHVQRGSRTADGAHGVFDSIGQTLLLTGDESGPPPTLRDGSETLMGERILLRVDSDDVDITRPKLVLRRSVPEAGTAASPQVPTRVEAARLRLDQSAKVARFTEDVVVHRGDLTVRAPRMDARYDGSGQLTQLFLRGGVDLRQGDRRATGQNADYDAQSHQVVLTGDPRLYDRGDVLVGDRIVLALDSHEVRVDHARGKLRPEAHQGEEASR